jgi:hypothetical protein
MLATQGSDWTAYCQVVGRSPCTATTAYPVQPGTDMVGQSGDGTDTLASTVPMPAACDQQGPTQCAAPAGEPLAVTVPASGSFTLTVATGTVTLTSDAAGDTATGALNPITVSDTRNTYPGWSVTGQTSSFTGSGTANGSTISGNQLGWVPADSSLATGATLGGPVIPAAPGLGTTAAVLASADPGGGAGTSVLGANVTLDIPVTAAAGPYLSTLTVTAITTGP